MKRKKRMYMGQPDSRNLVERAVKATVEADVNAQGTGFTHGEKLVRDCISDGTLKRKHGNVFSLRQRTLERLLDEAYSAGDDKSKVWASGVIEAKNRELKQLQQTLDDYTERMARGELLAILLMEKHGYPRS